MAHPECRRGSAPLPKRETRQHQLAVVILLGLLGSGSPALAQENPATAEARVHFDRAVDLFESGDARGALAEFERAYQLTGRASVLYNIGASYQALHDYPRAIDALRRYVASTEGRSTPQRDLAMRALSQMEPLVAHLRVVREPADATVLLDGRALESDRATVGPGAHVLTASAPGRESRQVEVTVVSGDEREVTLALALLTPTPPVVAQTPIPAPVVAANRRLFWSMVVTGGALALGASITGIVAIETQRDYASHRVGDPDVRDLASRGRALSWTADLLGVGALAAGATALVLGLRFPARSGAPTARAFVAPTAGGAALTAFGSF
ncbi:MAG: tetratricopeptide repeat protein [Deltaproteobacteria bacterium]|nr:tetratricopeptide repeat protein [Deltaproteobacteria bacterium]